MTMISLPAIVIKDDDLLNRSLERARQQLKTDDVNVVWIDETFHSVDDDDIADALYGKLVHEFTFEDQTGEVESVLPVRRNDGFFRRSSRISAIMVCRRRNLSDIDRFKIHLHPESCKLTEAERKALEKLIQS
ncbi:hypothetical protein IH992_29690 [Candidatus Poribacteria bacterium]|nr:hypothetical protein [Candidatus Poribacteria bacterium]